MSLKKRIILGIDPGSRCTGFGVVVQSGQKLHCLDYGQIKPSANSLADRLLHINQRLNELVVEHQPDEAAIEQIFTCRNPQSALKLGHARGAALMAVASLPLGEYAPRAIKQAVVGYGGASKEQVQHMVTRLLNLKSRPAADAADALAIALCHAHQPKNLLNQIQGKS